MKNRRRRYWVPLGVLALLAAGGPKVALAQFGTVLPGFYTLPDTDFTWVWGEIRELDLERSTDMEVRGFQDKFECTLTASMSPSSRLTRLDIREVERDLATSMFFIESSAQWMNQLDYSFDLDWGRLACVEREMPEPDAERQQEKLDRAVERALRERERRRARRAADED